MKNLCIITFESEKAATKYFNSFRIAWKEITALKQREVLKELGVE